ncbi:MAG: hypothetical protein WD267_13060 [Balneolales bacterium]
MKQFHIPLLLFLFLWGNSQLAHAQFFPLGLQGETRFVRQLDAMRWNLDGSVTRTGENYSLSLNNRFNSRIFMTGGIARNAQDENVMTLDATRWFNPRIGAVTEARSYTFTNTNLRQNVAFGGLAIRPIEMMEIRALGGFMSDRRSDHEDQGAAFALRAKMDPFKLGEVDILPGFSAERAMISPRTYQTLQFEMGAEYQNDDITIRTLLGMGGSTRESYQPTSFFNRDVTNIVESVGTDTTALNLAIAFPIGSSMNGQLDIQALSNDRRIESRMLIEDPGTTIYDNETRRQEVNVRYVTEYPIQSQPISFGMEYTFINRESRLINTDAISPDQVNRQNEILQNSNYNQSRFELFSDNRIQLNDRNILITRARMGIMRYDTPELNMDDRDELNYYFQLGNQHHFSDYLSGQITATAEALHYVYIHAVRSIENNWRRSIRLVPQLNWTPGRRLQISQQFLIRANYTVEDYELEGREKNDRASREFGFQTEADLILNKDWAIEIEGSRNELRIGRLFWDTFQEMPIDTLITYDGRLMFVRNYDHLRVAVGGRYFLRFDQLLQTSLSTTFINEEGIEQNITRIGPGRQVTHQFGPAVDISLPFMSGNRLYIRGWLQKQMVRKNLFITYPEAYSDAFRREESRYNTRILPNFEMTANFSF